MLRMKLLSINYQATGLLRVLISHIAVHLSAFRLQQHGSREMTNEGEKYHCVKIHERWCNSHDNPDIKGVILQGRTEQKLDWHFDLRVTATLTQSWIWLRYWSLFLLVILNRTA